MCAYRVIGAKNINGGRSEDLGERRSFVYACDCCVNQSLRSDVPASKRKNGQISCTGFAEFTECVIDPPQNVAKESERREVEMLPNGEPLSLKEPSERQSEREEPKLVISTKSLKELDEAMENTRRIQETKREESKSAMGKALSRRPAREAAEAEVVRSAASKMSDAERAKV